MPPLDDAPLLLGIPPPELLLPEEPLELPLAPPEEPPEDPLDDEPALPPPELLEELLEELFDELLADEPLDPELLGDGMDAEGMEGVEGVVGILADGQPAMSGKVTIATETHFPDCQFMSKPPWPNHREMPSALGQIPK